MPLNYRTFCLSLSCGGAASGARSACLPQQFLLPQFSRPAKASQAHSQSCKKISEEISASPLKHLPLTPAHACGLSFSLTQPSTILSTFTRSGLGPTNPSRPTTSSSRSLHPFPSPRSLLPPFATPPSPGEKPAPSPLQGAPAPSGTPGPGIHHPSARRPLLPGPSGRSRTTAPKPAFREATTGS